MRNNLRQKLRAQWVWRPFNRDEVVMATTRAPRYLTDLPGEDLSTSELNEVAGWISIYEELAAILRSVLARANHDGDADALQRNLAWVEERLAAWRDRHAALAGVAIDRKAHTITYGGRTIRLTRREVDLLDFMLRHPGRPFTTRQLATLA